MEECCQVVISIHMTALLERREVSQQSDELLQRIVLLGKERSQRIGKILEAFCQRIGLTAYRYLVETIGVESLPRQFQQSYRLKNIVKRLPFS